MTYVDLHLHLLPGVDDGPADEQASLEHARRLDRGCVREVVVTPHIGHPRFPVEIGTIARRTAALQEALRAAGIPLRLHPGGEIHPTAAADLTGAELDLVAQGPAGARWVLLEAPFAGIDERFLTGCRAIRRRGFALVIAHPERARGLLADGLGLLEGELAAGALLQVSVDSLLGDHGDEIRQAAHALIRRRLAYVIASDGHGAARPQTVAAGFALAVAAGITAEQACRLTHDNPAFLLRHGVPGGATTAPPPRSPWAPAHVRLVDATRRERGRLRR